MKSFSISKPPPKYENTKSDWYRTQGKCRACGHEGNDFIKGLIINSESDLIAGDKIPVKCCPKCGIVFMNIADIEKHEIKN